jgi:hypothetical protein
MGFSAQENNGNLQQGAGSSKFIEGQAGAAGWSSPAQHVSQIAFKDRENDD